jgi:Fe-S-cluster containining protein
LTTEPAEGPARDDRARADAGTLDPVMTRGSHDDEVLDAGPFSAWVGDMHRALSTGADADVPCGSCVACCASSQFVHIEPDEADALSHIPRQLLFPAPGLPRGHVLMGYDDRGRCPMLTDAGCSIYEHRPRTCRVYDCRVFPAADVTPDSDKPLIARQARRWRFDHPSSDDQTRHEATRSAAVFLRRHRDDLPADVTPRNASQHAVAALAVHDLFVGAEPDPAAVVVELQRRRH